MFQIFNKIKSFFKKKQDTTPIEQKIKSKKLNDILNNKNQNNNTSMELDKLMSELKGDR